MSRSPRGYTREAWLYLTYSFGSGFSLGFVQVLLGLYVLSVGYSESFLATQEFVIALSSATFSLMAGVVIDRLGTRVALILAAVATMLGRFLLVSHPSRTVILGASVVVACGIAFFWVSQGVVLAQVSTREQRARLFGLNWSLYTASSFLGGLVAGVLPSVLGPALGVQEDGPEAYRYTVWVGVSVLCVASLPLYWMHTGKRDWSHDEERAWWKVEQPRKVARLLIPVSTAALASGLTLPFLSVFLHGTFRASTASIGFAVGTFALVGSLGGLLGPTIRRRYGSVRTVSTLLVLSAPLMLSVGYAPSFGVASVALWVRGLLQNSSWPVALAFLIDSVPEHQRGRVSALMNVSFELSWALASLPAGLIMQHVSYRLPYAFAAGALAAGGLGFAYAFRTRAVPDPNRSDP